MSIFMSHVLNGKFDKNVKMLLLVGLKNISFLWFIL